MTIQQPEDTDSFVRIPITRNEFEAIRNIDTLLIIWLVAKVDAIGTGGN